MITNLKTLLLLIVYLNLGCSSQPERGAQKVPYEFESGSKMDQKEFWRIVDYSFNSANGDQKMQSQIISKELLRYTAEQIVDFELIFSKGLIEANDFKIMAAEKIIEGSVTDDSFLYFRCWLISRGQKTFEQTLKNPEYLANAIEKGADTDFEDFLYVTTTAYENKTGKKIEDDTYPRDVAFKKGLNYDFGGPAISGEEWKADELPKLYPKLWEKFN